MISAECFPSAEKTILFNAYRMRLDQEKFICSKYKLRLKNYFQLRDATLLTLLVHKLYSPGSYL